MNKWTKEEKKLLEKHNYTAYTPTFASYNYNTNWLYSTSLSRLKSGKIKYSSSYPINVDCDDGSFDMEYEEEIFESLKQYFKI